MILYRLLRLMIFIRCRLPSDDPKTYQKLRDILFAGGVIFIKLGQALSVRADLVGDQCANALRDFQDKLPPFAFDRVKEIIENSIPAGGRGLIQHIEPQAVAAASIAQVHKATLTDGRVVALKILRPNIAQKFDGDLKTLLFCAQMLEKFSAEARRLKLSDTLDYMQKIHAKECDLRYEAAAAEELAQNFKDSADIFYVPAVEWRLTSRNVACFEWVDGVRFDNKLAIEKMGLNPQTIVGNAARIFFLQVYRDGFFHGDLHPGNVFVRPDGVIVPVDFGIMGRISRQKQLFLADWLLGLLARDYHKIAQIHLQYNIIPANTNLGDFSLAMRAIGEKYLTRPWVEISVGALLAEMFEMTREFGMTTQIDLLLYQKGVLMAEGLGRGLDPSVNMWQLSQPLIAEWMRQNRSAPAKIKEFMYNLWQFIQNYTQNS